MNAPTIIVYTTATAPASEGVNIPILSPAIIPKGNNSAHKESNACLNISPAVAFFCLVGLYPLFLEIILTAIINPTAINILGTYAAINILPVETPAINEYIIRLIPGGITGVTAEDAAVIADEKALSY